MKPIITKATIMKKLSTVLDPELYISIVDMGLIYEVNIKNQIVNIKMTLTTIGCPLFNIIEENIKQAVLSVKGVKDVQIDLTFDPPWSMDMMNERGKAKLGIV
jgi:metal-sulfur cluster biosynthetic enzyme